MSSQNHRAFLFDMNGVIVDDEALHETAFREALGRKGFALSHRDYLDSFAGRTDRDGFIAFQTNEGASFDIEELLEEKTKTYQVLAKQGLVPYPDVLDLIAQLKSCNVLLALVTGAARAEAQAVLKAFDLIDCFQVVLSADDITEGKPSPKGYLLASQRLGVSPEECVVIEDAPSGVRAAKSAGMCCVAVGHTHDLRELSEADLIIERFDKQGLERVISLVK